MSADGITATPRTSTLLSAHAAGMSSSAPSPTPTAIALGRARPRTLAAAQQPHEERAGRERHRQQGPDRQPALPLVGDHRQPGGVHVGLPHRGDEQGAGERDRRRPALAVAAPQVHDPDRGQRGERRPERREIVEVEDPARPAVDDRVGQRPADPEEQAELRGGKRPPAAAAPQPGRADEGQRQQPLRLRGELAVREPQRAHRRAHEEPRVAVGGRRNGGRARRPPAAAPSPRRPARCARSARGARSGRPRCGPPRGRSSSSAGCCPRTDAARRA